MIEYRYDGARARYLDRQLDPAGLMATPQTFDILSETWTDYDGDNTYGDFTVTTGAVIDGTGYELGLAQISRPTPSTFDILYAHNDHLGTLRGQSNSTGFTTSYPVHTAFGEDMTGLGQRHSYVGAFGYQANTNFTALHVGARYYNTSSGRFLQRDPIGLLGGLNVYRYVGNSPLSGLDPSGLTPPYHHPSELFDFDPPRKNPTRSKPGLFPAKPNPPGAVIIDLPPSIQLAPNYSESIVGMKRRLRANQVTAVVCGIGIGGLGFAGPVAAAAAFVADSISAVYGLFE